MTNPALHVTEKGYEIPLTIDFDSTHFTGKMQEVEAKVNGFINRMRDMGFDTRGLKTNLLYQTNAEGTQYGHGTIGGKLYVPQSAMGGRSFGEFNDLITRSATGGMVTLNNQMGTYEKTMKSMP